MEEDHNPRPDELLKEYALHSSQHHINANEYRKSSVVQVQSSTTQQHGKQEPHNNGTNKFESDGRFKYFPGNTVVCQVPRAALQFKVYNTQKYIIND